MTASHGVHRRSAVSGLVPGSLAMGMLVMSGLAPAADSMAGKVMTVAGPIAPEALGLTLPHEHLFVDLRPPVDTREGWRAINAIRPSTPQDIAFYEAPLVLERIGAAYMGKPNRDNRRLDDEATAIREVTDFRWLGGGTIVDVTSPGIGRSPAALERVAALSGVHIVMGSGWYEHGYVGHALDDRSVSSLADELVADITVGVQGTGVRAGIIGEIGVGDSSGPYEQKVLAAAARASRQTGAAISVRMTPGRREHIAVLAVLKNAGADLTRVAMGHSNLIATDMLLMQKILDQGAYIQFDMLGDPAQILTEVSDHDVAVAIVELLGQGYGGQILLSQDVCAKTDLQAYGGSGYSFVAAQFIPYLRQLGVAQDQITQMVVDNPRRLLTLARPIPARRPT